VQVSLALVQELVLKRLALVQELVLKRLEPQQLELA
jgi:hypothetical protein